MGRIMTYALWIIGGMIALLLLIAGTRRSAPSKTRLSLAISFCLLLFLNLLGMAQNKPQKAQTEEKTSADEESPEVKLQKQIEERINEVKKAKEWKELRKTWKELSDTMIKDKAATKKLTAWADKYPDWYKEIKQKQDAEAPLFSKEETIAFIGNLTAGLIHHIYRSKGGENEDGEAVMETCYKRSKPDVVHNKDLAKQEELLDKQFKDNKITKEVYDKVKATLKTVRAADEEGLQIGANLNEPNTRLIFSLIRELNDKEVIKIEPPDAELQKKIDDLIKQLNDDDWETREKAQAELIKIGEQALVSLQKALESKEPEVKMRAKKIIETIEKPEEDADAEAVNKLIGQLGADDWEIRENATDELIKMGDRIIPQLEKALEDADNPETKMRLQLVIKKLGAIKAEKKAEGEKQGE